MNGSTTDANTWEAGRSKAVPIGEYEDVSVYGVHDMLGNVQGMDRIMVCHLQRKSKKDPKSGRHCACASRAFLQH